MNTDSEEQTNNDDLADVGVFFIFWGAVFALAFFAAGFGLGAWFY